MVMPNLDSAYNLLKLMWRGLSLGLILVGTARPMHILTVFKTVWRIINMNVVAAVDAAELEKAQKRRDKLCRKSVIRTMT